MSLLPTCVVCDALLRGYNGDCVCERCQRSCPTCGGDVAHCQHQMHPATKPVPYDRMSIDIDADGLGGRVAA